MLKSKKFIILMLALVVLAGLGGALWWGLGDKSLPTKQLSEAPNISDPFQAIQGQDLVALKSYLEAGGDPDKVNDQGQPLLLVASQRGYLDMVELLLAHQADPQKGDPSGLSPMRAAAVAGHTPVVRVLMLKVREQKAKSN